MMCTPDGAGCALAAPGRGFASVADALRVGRALEQLGAITSLLAAAQNAILRRFDADDGHDADGYASSATWLAARNHLSRRDAKAAVRQMRLLARNPHLDAATTTGALTISWAKEIAGWTGWAGTSSSCPRDSPAPPAPTAKPSSAATDRHHPNPAANPGPRLTAGGANPEPLCRPAPTQRRWRSARATGPGGLSLG
jgi:hypothetical protein